MPSMKEMQDAFLRADAAGDKVSAQALADGIRAEQAKSLAVSKAASENFDKAQESGDFNKNSPLYGTNAAERAIIGAGQGLTDKWLGARQLANSVSGGLIGDKDKLAAEAAEKEHLDKKILDTGAGNLGSIVGATAPDLLLGGGAGAVAKKGAVMLAPKVARFLPEVLAKALPATATSAAVGAESGVTEPDKDYSATKQGGLGALFGIGGDVAARGVGRVLSPRWESAKASVKEHLANLEGMPLLAETVTGSKILKAATNALEQIPGFNYGVKKTRSDALGTITGDITGAAGHRTEELSQEQARQMVNKLKGQGSAIRAGPDVPLTNMSTNLQTTLDAMPDAALAGGRTPAADKLKRAIDATASPGSPTPTVPDIFKTLDEVATTQPGPRIANTIEQAATDLPHGHGKGIVTPTLPPSAPPQVPTITANDAMTLRSQATKEAHDRNATEASKKAARSIRDELDSALEKTMTPEQQQQFGKFKAEWGTAKDIEAAGVNAEGHIRPEDFAKTLTKAQQLAPDTPLERRVMSAAHMIPSPSLADNRSLMTRFIMGASIPGAGAAIGGSGGDPGNAAIGAGTSLALAHLLLGTKGGGRYLTGHASSKLGKAAQSEMLRDMLRRGGQVWGGQLANDF